MTTTQRRCPGCSAPVAAHRPWCANCDMRMPDPLRRNVATAHTALGTATRAAADWLARNPHATRREIDIITLLADGLEYQQIAAQLTISIETVKYHLGEVSRRWGCKGRAHIVGTAYQLGHLKTRNRA